MEDAAPRMPSATLRIFIVDFLILRPFRAALTVSSLTPARPWLEPEWRPGEPSVAASDPPPSVKHIGAEYHPYSSRNPNQLRQ